MFKNTKMEPSLKKQLDYFEDWATKELKYASKRNRIKPKNIIIPGLFLEEEKNDEKKIQTKRNGIDKNSQMFKLLRNHIEKSCTVLDKRGDEDQKEKNKINEIKPSRNKSKKHNIQKKSSNKQNIKKTQEIADVCKSESIKNPVNIVSSSNGPTEFSKKFRKRLNEEFLNMKIESPSVSFHYIEEEPDEVCVIPETQPITIDDINNRLQEHLDILKWEKEIENTHDRCFFISTDSDENSFFNEPNPLISLNFKIPYYIKPIETSKFENSTFTEEQIKFLKNLEDTNEENELFESTHVDVFKELENDYEHKIKILSMWQPIMRSFKEWIPQSIIEPSIRNICNTNLDCLPEVGSYEDFRNYLMEKHKKKF